jgi:hypothetical protein
VRAVLDSNVLISALLSPRGAPAALVRAWLSGRFELVLSHELLQELTTALGYPKLAIRVPETERDRLIDCLLSAGTLVDDPGTTADGHAADPGDEYLIALARSARAVLVSGDRHLLALAPALPVYSPREFLVLLGDT